MNIEELEEDKGKRPWTGYLPHVEINGTSTKFWKFVETVMSICWSPTSESDMALTSDRITDDLFHQLANHSMRSAVPFRSRNYIFPKQPAYFGDRTGLGRVGEFPSRKSFKAT